MIPYAAGRESVFHEAEIRGGNPDVCIGFWEDNKIVCNTGFIIIKYTK